MLTNKKLSIVVVCYRDEGNIREMYRRLSLVVPKITPDYEIIYVNDASPDNSYEILSELAGKDRRLTVITHSRNFGAQAGFTSGMIQSLGGAVVIMDGDLQDPPEIIEEMVKKWLEGFDVVYGVRRKREASMGMMMELFYHLFYVTFDKLSYIRVPRDAGEFSLMDRKVVDWINLLPERDRLIRGLRAWVGFKQTGVEYVRPERFWGKSTNSLFKNLKWAKKAIFSFSYVPLELISQIAFFTFLISLAAIVFYAVFYFIKPDAPKGFLTITIISLFLGSVQLLSLSIIGEYIGRMFEETKGRPRFIVRDIVNNHRVVDDKKQG